MRALTVADRLAAEIYTDGGIIGHNPSCDGGTWAYCIVRDGVMHCDRSGYLLPSDVAGDTVTNNNTELAAIMEAIEELPDGFVGRLNSDSRIALGWVFLGWKTENVPAPLLTRLEAVRARLSVLRLTWRLLDGHPTKAQLESGRGKRGNPCSEFNVFCDRECGRLAAAFTRKA